MIANTCAQTDESDAEERSKERRNEGGARQGEEEDDVIEKVSRLPRERRERR